MVDTPTTRNRFRKQETGTNTNTWGTNLNQVLDCVDQVTDGVESIALTGVDYTLTTTNYTTADEAKNRVLKLTGVSTTAINVILPSVEHEYEVINQYGATVTVKTAAGTGVAIPTLHNAIVYCDGANVYNGSPTLLPGEVTIAGKLHGMTAGTANTDGVNVAQLAAAVAAGGGVGAGTIFVSVNDSTPNYLDQKLAEGTGIDLAVVGAAGTNQTLTVTVDTIELEEFLALTGKINATITSGTTAMTDRRRTKITGGTGTLPTMAAGSFVIAEIAPAAGVTATIGRNAQTIDGLAADDTYTGSGGTGPVIMYEYVSAGVVTSRLIGGSPV